MVGSGSGPFWSWSANAGLSLPMIEGELSKHLFFSAVFFLKWMLRYVKRDEIGINPIVSGEGRLIMFFVSNSRWKSLEISFDKFVKQLVRTDKPFQVRYYLVPYYLIMPGFGYLSGNSWLVCSALCWMPAASFVYLPVIYSGHIFYAADFFYVKHLHRWQIYFTVIQYR